MSKLSDSLKDNAARLKDNAHDLTEKAGERLAAAKDSARDLADNARAKSEELVASGREKVSHGVEVTREKVAHGVDVAREKAHVVSEKGKETLDNRPLTMVAGGLVLGAIVAALLPTTATEREKLGGTGEKLKNRVKSATAAAKETGAAKMKDSGLDTDALKGQLGDIVSKGMDILKDATKAATDAAKKG